MPPSDLQPNVLLPNEKRKHSQPYVTLSQQTAALSPTKTWLARLQVEDALAASVTCRDDLFKPGLLAFPTTYGISSAVGVSKPLQNDFYNLYQSHHASTKCLLTEHYVFKCLKNYSYKKYSFLKKRKQQLHPI